MRCTRENEGEDKRVRRDDRIRLSERSLRLFFSVLTSLVSANLVTTACTHPETFLDGLSLSDNKHCTTMETARQNDCQAQLEQRVAATSVNVAFHRCDHHPVIIIHQRPTNSRSPRSNDWVTVTCCQDPPKEYGGVHERAATLKTWESASVCVSEALPKTPELHCQVPKVQLVMPKGCRAGKWQNTIRVREESEKQEQRSVDQPLHTQDTRPPRHTGAKRACVTSCARHKETSGARLKEQDVQS